MDFSQGELVLDQFALKFETEKLASLFQTEILECQEALRQNSSSDEPVVPAPTVVIVIQQLENINL